MRDQPESHFLNAPSTVDDTFTRFAARLPQGPTQGPNKGIPNNATHGPGGLPRGALLTPTLYRETGSASVGCSVVLSSPSCLTFACPASDAIATDKTHTRSDPSLPLTAESDVSALPGSAPVPADPDAAEPPAPGASAAEGKVCGTTSSALPAPPALTVPVNSTRKPSKSR